MLRCFASIGAQVDDICSTLLGLTVQSFLLPSSTGRSIRFSNFTPSRLLMRHYIPFFDQYSQSMSIWAPDSSAFVYAGNAESDANGTPSSVWVQKMPISDTEESPAPLSLGEGDFAAWSPR
mmetsp:Transcript_38254/g.61983  ORF Transcript_38254/g.61983 Transcript_38254/m.61983 type:complete len:121 (+) Transcript_38254:328-690(+)